MSDNPSSSQKKRAEVEAALESQVQVNRQLSRTIWSLVATAPDRTVIIDEGDLHPLWLLEYSRPSPANPTIVKIVANQMSEPAEAQIAELAHRLLETGMSPGDAQVAVGLGEYPFSYLNRFLMKLAVFNEGKWISRADYDALPKPEGTVELAQ